MERISLGGYGLYLLFSLPALLLELAARAVPASRADIKKYSRVANMSGMKGSEVARRILDYNGLTRCGS